MVVEDACGGIDLGGVGTWQGTLSVLKVLTGNHAPRQGKSQWQPVNNLGGVDVPIDSLPSPA